MCGRFSLDALPNTLAQHFGLNEAPALQPRDNIAPSQDIAVIRLRGRERECALLRWGLVPAWSREPKTRYSTINARAETVAEKPAYRNAFRQRRCLIPATGFYEWQKTPDGKVPYHIVPLDELWAFAGLWERWEKGDEPLETFTILTTEAAQSIEQIHPRMPTILEPAEYDAWLELDTGKDDLAQLAGKQFPDARMRAYPVNTRVNTPKNDDAELIEEMGAA